MNVFLMFRDRDSISSSELPPNEAVLTQDLELDTLFDAMAHRDEYLWQVVKQTLFCGLKDSTEIRYRQEILKDCLKNPSVIREIYHIPIESMERKRERWMGIFTTNPTGVLHSAIEMLTMFVELLKRLRSIADEHAAEFESEGFSRFFAMIQQELGDDFFAAVEEHLKTLRFRRGVMLSAELGRGNEGTNYVLRKANGEGQNWVQRVLADKSPVYSYSLDPRDEHGGRALGELRDQGVNLVANAVAQSADHIDSFFNQLRLELAFYIGCLNLYEELGPMEEPICFPDPAPAQERRHAFTELYDISLALTVKERVVGNSINANGKDLVIITGANQGGKSTFLRSIGLAQLMMQAGMFVAAQSFSANLGEGVFTHYKREEDATMKSGKLDEELARMSDIVDHLTPNALVLFNESFAATNEREGSEIARQIVSALLAKHIKVFFVTHLYEFAHGLYAKGTARALFLRAERQPDGTRTFKLKEGEPLQTSYGVDLFERIFNQ